MLAPTLLIRRGAQKKQKEVELPFKRKSWLLLQVSYFVLPEGVTQLHFTDEEPEGPV